MNKFVEIKPKDETLWRAIILFGRNVASYKFALSMSLIEIADKSKTFISMDELAEPFSRHLSAHVKLNSKQGTFAKSSFIQACTQYNNNQITKEELISRTVSIGFNNVIDAFHIVNRREIPKRFYIDDRKTRNGITITDDLLALKQQLQFKNLPLEVEARWRLVETAWPLNLTPRLLEVHHDDQDNILYVRNDNTQKD
jgi:hypothetical protein